VLCVG